MSKRARVSHLVLSLNPGGAEWLAAQMASALRDDFDVSVACLDEPGRWAADLRSEGIPVYCYFRQPGLDLRVAWLLAEHARRDRVDLFHAHQVAPWFYGSLAKLLAPRVRVVFEEHGRFHPEASNAVRSLFNKGVLLPLTSRAVAVADDVRQRLAIYEGISKSRVEVIYNGVHRSPLLTSSERGAIRAGLGFGPADFVVGTSGRFEAVKNLALLLRAVAQTGTREIKCLLVGDGPMLQELRELAVSLGLRDAAVFTGFRPDASRLTAAMDLFVLSSRSEGTSLALLESMAAGIPAVVTDVGGNPEVVVDQVTGWIVPSESVERMSSAIVEAFTDPARRSRLGGSARIRFEERFTFDGMLARYKRLYAEVLNGTSG